MWRSCGAHTVPGRGTDWMDSLSIDALDSSDGPPSQCLQSPCPGIDAPVVRGAIHARLDRRIAPGRRQRQSDARVCHGDAGLDGGWLVDQRIFVQVGDFLLHARDRPSHGKHRSHRSARRSPIRRITSVRTRGPDGLVVPADGSLADRRPVRARIEARRHESPHYPPNRRWFEFPNRATLKSCPVHDRA